MPSLDDLKKRIKSVKSTQKITKDEMVLLLNLEKHKKMLKRDDLIAKRCKILF